MTQIATHPIPTADPPDLRPPGTVRKARAGEAARLAQILARAFEHDPVTAWVFPREADRLPGMEAMYRRILVPDALRDDEAYLTEDHAAAALWAPPGRAKAGAVETLRMVPAIARIWGRRSVRAMRVFSYLESKLPERPHAHLLFMGVEPEHQGYGIGSLLLRRTLAPLDREGMPAYLEATTPRNRALYRRHGFMDMEQIRLPGGGPPMWRMWRDPA